MIPGNNKDLELSKKILTSLIPIYQNVLFQTRDGKFELLHMDEFVDELLREERVLDVILPRMQVKL